VKRKKVSCSSWFLLLVKGTENSDRSNSFLNSESDAANLRLPTAEAGFIAPFNSLPVKQIHWTYLRSGCAGNFE